MPYAVCESEALNRMSTSFFRFTKPVRHENLEIQFLIGPSVPPDYLTLAEGCSQQIVDIFETCRVGRLAVINRSADRPLFIQLGELLKGGLQDRTIATDLVLDPGEKFDGGDGLLRRTSSMVETAS